jgi:CheY-like chemotaxis protein
MARRRVLVVDDNEDAAECLALFLALSGNESLTASDGPSAVRGAGTFHPDAVVLDIGLPGMGGCEVARRIREVPGLDGVVLVALTGRGDEADRQRCLEAGFDFHLVKPADPLEVQVAIEGR